MILVIGKCFHCGGDVHGWSGGQVLVCDQCNSTPLCKCPCGAGLTSMDWLCLPCRGRTTAAQLHDAEEWRP